MKKLIDLKNWNRLEHFNFFKGFDDSFWGLTANVDFTAVYKRAKEEKASFFLYSLHAIMQTVNNQKEFRYRIEGENVACYDTIHPSPTIGRKDGTFAISFFEYRNDMYLFVKGAKKAIEEVNNSTGLGLNENAARQDVIHYSSLPWIRFTEMKHTASFGNDNSVPKISTGKLFEDQGRMILPVSITVNHALIDGWHVAQFLEKLENNTR